MQDLNQTQTQDGHNHSRQDTPGQAFSHIPGWGADLDPADRPAYPMERNPPRPIGVHWDQPEQQAVNVKVLHSNERTGITPVFGSTLPPSGLSGKVREGAFKFSENDIRHWLLLLLADRINMVEGVGADLMRGYIPNIFAEMGGKAEFKYNRAGAVRKAALASAVVALSVYLVAQRRRRRSANKKILRGWER